MQEINSYNRRFSIKVSANSLLIIDIKSCSILFLGGDPRPVISNRLTIQTNAYIFLTIVFIFQLLDYLRDLPTLSRHLWNEFFSLDGLMHMFRLRLLLCFVAGLIYLISPLDIIPEGKLLLEFWYGLQKFMPNY